MRSMLITLLCLTGSALAAAAPITIVRQHTVYDLAADGTWTAEWDVARRVDEPAAVNGAGQAPVQYSDSLQQLEILEAYTLTKDGTRIDVAPDRILTQQLPASTNAPMYGDTRVKVVVFPQVEVGATLNLRYRLTQRAPFLPDVFSAVVSINRFVDLQDASVTLRAPTARTLHIRTDQMQGGEVASATAGRREWRYTFQNATALLPEPGSVIPEKFSPYFAVSSLAQYPELGKSYMVGAARAAQVTPAVQALADGITAGLTDRRAQAEALYRWVSREIRYVSIAIGAGGFVPHVANEILAARYGDCKDKTTLLIALLQAKGIRAMPALIHTAATFDLPEAVILSAFNHVITYLPEWDLFVDATSGFAPFGVLPNELMGKPTLLGGDATTAPVVKHIPMMDAARDRLVMRTTATLTADGTVSGTNQLEGLGAAETALRGSFAPVTDALRPALAQQLLARSGQTGEASLKLSDMRDLTQPFAFTFTFRVPARVNLPGPGALPTAFGMPLPSGAQAFVTSALRQERQFDFPCPQGATDEQLELTLPPDLRLTTLPPSVVVQSAYGRFVARYAVKDGKLTVQRTLDLAPGKLVCTREDTAALRKFATDISQHLRAQLLYQ